MDATVRKLHQAPVPYEYQDCHDGILEGLCRLASGKGVVHRGGKACALNKVQNPADERQCRRRLVEHAPDGPGAGECAFMHVVLMCTCA